MPEKKTKIPKTDAVHNSITQPKKKGQTDIVAESEAVPLSTVIDAYERSLQQEQGETVAYEK